VIIVGLGCFGLGTAYYLSKMGLKVLGLDRSHEAGTMGSGSTGYARIWRHLHAEKRYFDMQMEAIEMWKEIEKATN
jgi:sarcosine oxidase